MKYLILALWLVSIAFWVFFFAAILQAKDQSRITDQDYVLAHILKGKPCVR